MIFSPIKSDGSTIVMHYARSIGISGAATAMGGRVRGGTHVAECLDHQDENVHVHLELGSAQQLGQDKLEQLRHVQARVGASGLQVASSRLQQARHCQSSGTSHT